MKNFKIIISMLMLMWAVCSSCEKDEEVVEPVWETYKGVKITCFGFTSDFRYNHSQNGTSVNLTSGYIHLDHDSKKFRKVFNGYTVDTWKAGEETKLYDKWTKTFKGNFRFTDDQQYIIFGDYGDSARYISGSKAQIIDQGSFHKDHLMVIGTFTYEIVSP